MSLKRILGTMLASRMAGRGARRGAGGGSPMSAALGHRRPGGRLGGKLGVGALGYMAYQAYQDHQSRSAGAGGRAGGGASGGIGGMIKDVADRVTGGGASSRDGGDAAPADRDEEARAAEQLSDATALLLIRAMITAAYADGALSQDERARIMREIDEAGADEEDRRILEREIADPQPLDDLLVHVRDEETAEEFYLASSTAVNGETEDNRAYLADLRRRLGLSAEDAAEIAQMAS
jgi:uncharacterized membrane protein YebE (DUF533 family)